MRRNRLLASVSSLGLVAIIAGWGRGQEKEGPGHARSVADRSMSAAISGVVKFGGTPPTMPLIDMSAEAVCFDGYPEPPQERTVIVNENGTLKNVFVYVKAGLDENTRFPVPHDSVWIEQSKCRYEPHVVGLQVGQTIAIKNLDPVLHHVNAKPNESRRFSIAQPVQHMVTARSFQAPEIMVPVVCDVHGWMHAYVGVLGHPYFATTGDDGSFAIADLPPGTYVIEAWQESYGAQSVAVTVGANESKAIELTFGAPAGHHE